VAAIGIVLVLAIAWRISFRPFRRAWPRWIPLPVVLLGIGIGIHVFPDRGETPDFLFHVLPMVVALLWAVTLGAASPSLLVRKRRGVRPQTPQ
jgi:hypothetical protein